MEHDVIILYLIAGVSFTFALFNCILFALKHGKTMKTDGMIVSIKSQTRQTKNGVMQNWQRFPIW
ncbi:hypothetical protein DW955_03575 [Ruminococcus sp. AM45-9BH]|nr:hypothetical protein DWY78_14185 [Ruminococcus sp. AF27-12AA]RHS63987.1 hypothetical protein DW955_03575 [Ruminococcus sp. AM45-9BH]